MQFREVSPIIPVSAVTTLPGLYRVRHNKPMKLAIASGARSLSAKR